MAEPAPTEFELEGRRFQVKRLDTDAACASLELVCKAVGPAISAVFEADPEVLATIGEEGADSKALGPVLSNVLVSVLSNASQISALLKVFLPVSKFDRGGDGKWVDLKPFVGEVFAGRVDLVIAFLAHAVRAEHSCFLGGHNALAELVTQLTGSASASRTAPTG